MLWINERMITEYDGGRHVEYDVHITRGDTAYVEVVPMQDGEPYTFQTGDTITLQVRTKPIKNDATTPLVFAGEVTVENSIPVWHLRVSDTTRDCGVYYWDCQLNSGSEVSTYLIGTLWIEEEKTV